MPFGRPRWVAATTWAPWPTSHSIVGRAARMRRSSVISPSRSGTLKSARSRTRRPSSGGRSSSVGTPVIGGSALVGGADDQGQVDEAVRVAPLVVVPAEHLDQAADGLGKRGVEGAGGGRA